MKAVRKIDSKFVSISVNYLAACWNYVMIALKQRVEGGSSEAELQCYVTVMPHYISCYLPRILTSLYIYIFFLFIYLFVLFLCQSLLQPYLHFLRQYLQCLIQGVVCVSCNRTGKYSVQHKKSAIQFQQSTKNMHALTNVQ